MRAREVLAMLGSPLPTRRPALTVDELHARARRRLPAPVADYLDGGSDDERALAGNEAAFASWTLRPDVFAGVARVDPTVAYAGRTWAAPIGFSPTGSTRMFHPDGERAVARVAAARGVPYVLSTVATTTIEDVARVSGSRPPWLQLYQLRDRAVTDHMVDRAAAAGVEVLELAVDTATTGNRLRDRRHGLSIPPRLAGPTLLRIGAHPRYWWQVLQAPALDFAQVGASLAAVGPSGGSAGRITDSFEPALDWADLDRLRARWPGRLLLKGPVGPADARRAVEAGADGVHLSNHGGRQLDRTIAPLRLVPAVRAAVGDGAVVVVDSGVRSGIDVAIALALGADAAFVGRPYLWGLAAEGPAGVDRVVTILLDELVRTMHLLGVADVAALRARGVDLLSATHLG